jgi:hypothetical protein
MFARTKERQMDRDERTRPRIIRPVRVASIALFGLLLVSGPAVAACSDGHAASDSTTSGSAMSTAMPSMADDETPATLAKLVWDSRPAFVSTNAEVEEAYAYALTHPKVVAWMPCYCGCAAMGHGSNLDCYFKAGVVSDRAQFDEHASFCDICVQITLKTKELRAQGRSLAEIRQIVDQTFGGSGAPGTLTAQPPV